VYTGSDVARWSAEQRKDLAVIGQQMVELRATVDPLHAQIVEEQKKNKKMSAVVAENKKQANVERETSAITRRQYESKIKVCYTGVGKTF